MTLPNLITVARFLLAPLVVWALLNDRQGLALAVFVVAGLSDGIDGFIARAFDQRSELGAWLDPAADKLLLVTIYLMLGWTGGVPDWLVVMIVTRDGLIVGAVVLSSLMGTALEMKPLFVSKANTTAQIALAALVLAQNVVIAPVPDLTRALVVLTAFLTLSSGFAYVLTWMRVMSASPETFPHDHQQD